MSTHSILTFVSTGGPATNVTWTRGSDENNLVHVSENIPVSVLNNATTAQYNHTLNVSGTKLPAVYGCSVSNNKPSSAKVIVTSEDMNVILYDANTELMDCVLSFHCRCLNYKTNLHFQ